MSQLTILLARYLAKSCTRCKCTFSTLALLTAEVHHTDSIYSNLNWTPISIRKELIMAEEWKIMNVNRRHMSFDDEKEKKWTEPYYFIQGADCQLGLIQRYMEKNPVPGWKKEISLTKLAVEKINALKPKPRFFVICGDLCDAFPTKEPDLRAKQEKDLKEILSQLDPEIPLVCVCGNHDVGDQPTEADIQQYGSSFGDDYFSFWCGGVLCLVVNSQLWADASQVPSQAAAQDAWLEEQLTILSEARSCGSAAFALVFQHIPWFLKSADETTVPYFTIKPDVRSIWMPKFKAAGVKAIFCGHYHRNAGGWFEDMEVIVTSAIGGQMGDDQSGMRVVQVLPTGVKHKYYNLEDIPSQLTNL